MLVQHRMRAFGNRLGWARVALALSASIVSGCYETTTPPDADSGTDPTDSSWTDVDEGDGSVDATPLDAEPADASDAAGDTGPICTPSREICNAFDDDCDGSVDEDPEASTWCGARCGVDPCPRARPIAPLSSALLVTRRPTFRWVLEAGADSARVEVCRDRACADVVTTISGTTSAGPAADLPQGVLFWRLVPRRAGVDLPAVSPTWIARVPPVTRATGGMTGIVLDVDADGRADVLLGRTRAGTSSTREWLLFAGSTTGLGERARLADTVLEVGAVLDADGDGHADAVTFEADTTGVSVRRGAPFGWTGTSELLPPSVSWTLLTGAGDADGDGYVDLFFGRGHLVRGGPSFDTTPVVVADPPYSQPEFDSTTYAVGDLDADGVADFLAMQSCRYGVLAPPWVTCASDRSIWRIRGGTVLAAAERWAHVPLGSTSPGPDADTLAPITSTGDVDGDGLVDLIALPSGMAPRLLLNRSATPSVDSWTPLDTDDTVAWVGPACDLDGDGADDLVLTRTAWRNTSTFVRRGGASGPRAEQIVLSNLQAAATSCLGDDDGDGFSDVAVLLYDPELPGSFVLHVYRGTAGGVSTMPVQAIAVGDVGGTGGPGHSMF